MLLGTLGLIRTAIGSGLQFRQLSNKSAPATIGDLISKLRKEKFRSGKSKQSSNLVYQKTTESVTKSTSNVWQQTESFPKSLTEDRICDGAIRQLIETKQIEKLRPKLIWFEDLDRFPSKKTLIVLASIFSSSNDINGITIVQRICSKAYPQEYKWIMGYRHYEAELLWKLGQFNESIDLFEELFKQNVKQRHKLGDMIAFLMKHVFSTNLSSVYSRLSKFSHSCVELEFYSPAVNFWASTFTSKDHRAWLLGEEVVTKYPQIKPLVTSRFNKIITFAYENGNKDILQRLVQFVLVHQLDNWRSKLMAAQLNFQCENNDLTGALETFHYSASMAIPLPANIVQRLLCELHRDGRPVPQLLLYVKYRRFKPTSLTFNW